MKVKSEVKTSDAVTILSRMAGERPRLRSLTEEARLNAAVAQLIYAARTKSGLSQMELAARIRSKQSVISRLEDADYEGHSLTMLQRIATAMGQSIEIRFQPMTGTNHSRRYVKTSTRRMAARQKKAD